MSDSKTQIQEKVIYLEEIISSYLPREAGLQKHVLEAMNYSVLAGGKRLRPMLMLETYYLCGGTKEAEYRLHPFLAAIEMIHTYSLVHDDLPAMDNDRYRRGKETTWAVYGEAMGILAGDGLLNYAFETASKALLQEKMELSDYRRASLALSVLAQKAGVFGMVGGQTADLEAENSSGKVTKEHLLFIHEHKTAALIQAAMMIGAIMADAGQEQIERIEKCGYKIGVAFQIQDDILDVTGDQSVLGKPIGSDAENGKQTYVTMEGLEKSAHEVEVMSAEAVSILDSFDRKNEFLKDLVLQLIHREK